MKSLLTMADALKYRFGKVIDLPRPLPFDIFPNRELIQSGKGKGRAAPGAHATENLYSSFRVQSDNSIFSTYMDAKEGCTLPGSRNDLLMVSDISDIKLVEYEISQGSVSTI